MVSSLCKDTLCESMHAASVSISLMNLLLIQAQVTSKVLQTAFIKAKFLTGKRNFMTLEW